MQHTHRRTDRGTDLESPVRNNYFYGQLLGVENFELETGYSIAQRRLLNRVVLGYGVVCGLGVRVLSGGRRIAISAGVALDRWGREIIVPRETDPTKTPGAYEFPREFRKLRNTAVTFLVDVCRPSALRTGSLCELARSSSPRPGH